MPGGGARDCPSASRIDFLSSPRVPIFLASSERPLTMSARRGAGFRPVQQFLLAAALVVSALPATAQTTIESLDLTITATPAISSDYLIRGISQTRNNWAFSGTFDVAHESGVFVGAFISNAKFLAAPYNDTRQELDVLTGYRFEVAGIGLDIGYIGYFYPGQDKPDGTQLNEYHEVALKASYTIDTVKLLGAFNYSPNFFGRSGNG